MLILQMLTCVGAYYLASPSHTLVISARSFPYRSDSFPLTQLGPYKTSSDPILFARAFRPGIDAGSEGKEKNKPEGGDKDDRKELLPSAMFTSTMCKFFFYTVMAVLIFFIGYQTRKCHEGGSYVRLPTNN